MKRMVVGAAVVGFGVMTAAGCAVPTEPTDKGSESAGSTEQASTTGTLANSPCSGVGVTSQYATVLMRIPDSDGCNATYEQRYSWDGHNYCDGYSVEFPTPWVGSTYTPNSVYQYEYRLWNYIPTSQPYEYLVQRITVGTCVNSATGAQYTCFRSYYGGSTREFFSVPVTSASDYSAVNSLALDYQSDPAVESYAHTCVYYVDAPPGTTFPIATGNPVPLTVSSFVYVADTHDPTKNPN